MAIHPEISHLEPDIDRIKTGISASLGKTRERDGVRFREIPLPSFLGGQLLRLPFPSWTVNPTRRVSEAALYLMHQRPWIDRQPRRFLYIKWGTQEIPHPEIWKIGLQLSLEQGSLHRPILSTYNWELLIRDNKTVLRTFRTYANLDKTSPNNYSIEDDFTANEIAFLTFYHFSRLLMIGDLVS